MIKSFLWEDGSAIRAGIKKKFKKTKKNSQAIKKDCSPQKRYGEKKDMKVAQNSPELSLLKFLPLTYHHRHSLAATLDFTSFFIFTPLYLGDPLSD